MKKRNRRTAQSIDADLGLQRRVAVVPTSPVKATELSRTVDTAKRRAVELMGAPGPQTVVDRIIDRFLPSPARQERERVDQEILRAEGSAMVKVHEITTGALVHELSVTADVWEKTIELRGVEEIGVRALEVADRLDSEIARTGEAFDGVIDQAVNQARSHKSATARTLAADRIEMRADLRARVEEALAERVVRVVQRSNESTEK